MDKWVYKLSGLVVKCRPWSPSDYWHSTTAAHRYLRGWWVKCENQMRTKFASFGMWPSHGLCPSYLIKPTLLQDLSTVTQTTKLIKTFQAAACCGHLGLPLYMSCFLTPTCSKLDAASQAMQPGSGKWQRVCSNLLPSQLACSPTVLLSLTLTHRGWWELFTYHRAKLWTAWFLGTILYINTAPTDLEWKNNTENAPNLCPSK